MGRSRWDQKPEGYCSAMVQGKSATSSASLRPPTPFHHKLPPEIRNAIYALVMADQADPAFTYLDYGIFVGITTRLIIPAQPSLAHTCRQVRDEVLSLYYTTVTLEKASGLPTPKHKASILTHPAIAAALKYARTMEFKFDVTAHSGTYQHEIGLQIHSNVRRRPGKVRIYRTVGGVHVDTEVHGRCCCDLDGALREIADGSKSVDAAFMETFAWVSENMINSLAEICTCSEMCKACGKFAPRMDLRSLGMFVANNDPTFEWLGKQEERKGCGSG